MDELIFVKKKKKRTAINVTLVLPTYYMKVEMCISLEQFIFWCILPLNLLE